MHVEFLAGTSLADCVSEAIEKASMWNVACVEFNYSEVTFMLGPKANKIHVLDEYDSYQNGERPRNICAL